MGDQHISSRPWTALSRSAAPSNSDAPQSSSSSIRSLRKRGSFFFGRSRSDASKARLNQQPTSPPVQEEEEPSRPPTAYSNQTARSKADSLHALRDTLLGGRRRPPPPPPISASDDSVPSLYSTRKEPTPSVPAARSVPEFQSGDQCEMALI